MEPTRLAYRLHPWLQADCRRPCYSFDSLESAGCRCQDPHPWAARQLTGEKDVLNLQNQTGVGISPKKVVNIPSLYCRLGVHLAEGECICWELLRGRTFMDVFCLGSCATHGWPQKQRGRKTSGKYADNVETKCVVIYVWKTCYLTIAVNNAAYVRFPYIF